MKNDLGNESDVEAQSSYN